MEWVKASQDGGGDWGDEKTWTPEGESEIVGKLISKATVDTKRGPVVKLRIEEEKSGDIYAVWASRAGLKTLVEEYDDMLTAGRTIGIRCGDQVKIEGGKTFYPYELGFLDKVSASPAPKLGKEEPF
jgi:hypothetical protein